MRDWQSQAHVQHYCRYHIVFVPKYPKQAIDGGLRKKIVGIFRELSRQGDLESVEGYAIRDHIHVLLTIPPKFSVANTVGFLKGKPAIRILREYLQVKQNFMGRHVCGCGYCVTTVGLDEQLTREYTKNQEQEEKRQEQMKLAEL